MPMKYLIILLSLMFSTVKAQRSYSYNLTYHNTEIRAIYCQQNDGKSCYSYGLFMYGREVLPIKYQFEYEEFLKLFVFYNQREVRVISALTGKEVKRYMAPKKLTVMQARFKPITSYTYDVVIKTKEERTLTTYTIVKGKVYEIPFDNRYVVH